MKITNESLKKAKELWTELWKLPSRPENLCTILDVLCIPVQEAEVWRPSPGPNDYKKGDYKLCRYAQDICHWYLYKNKFQVAHMSSISNLSEAQAWADKIIAEKEANLHCCERLGQAMGIDQYCPQPKPFGPDKWQDDWM